MNDLNLNISGDIGPKIGKPNPYKGIEIPIKSNIPFKIVMAIGLFKFFIPHPIPSPNNPVPKGKMKSSLGSIRINKNIAKK